MADRLIDGEWRFVTPTFMCVQVSARLNVYINSLQALCTYIRISGHSQRYFD